MARRAGSAFRLGMCCAVAAIAMGDGAAVTAGLVITRNQRLTGEIAVRDGSLTVAGKTVPWADVVLAIKDQSDPKKAAPNAIELTNGEVWSGQIEAFKEGVVEFTSSFLGKRTVPAAEIRSLNFQPALPPALRRETNVLHRLRGKPSAGALILVDAKRITAETSLGPLSFDRDKIERYVFKAGTANAVPAGDRDEVGLANTSIVCGNTRLTGPEIVLNHAGGGEMKLAADAWRWVRRGSQAVVHLADTTPESTRTSPLIRRNPELPRVECGPPVAPDHAPEFVRRLHVSPKTTLTYQPRAGDFRCGVALAPRSRGTAVVRFRAGEKVVREETLDPGNKTAVAVMFSLDADAALGVEVDFGNAILFPCGVVIDDPFLILRQ